MGRKVIIAIVAVAVIVLAAVIISQLKKPKEPAESVPPGNVFGVPEELLKQNGERFTIPAPAAINQIYGRITLANVKEKYLKVIIDNPTQPYYQVFITADTKIYPILLPNQVANREQTISLDKLRAGDYAEIKLKEDILKITTPAVTAISILPTRF